MTKEIHYSDYNNFAWVYNKHWAYMFSGKSFPILEKLMLQYLPSNARILDLCCGSGKLAKVLAERGYLVTGVDASEEMIKYARENAPNVEFIVDDARYFKLPATYNGIISAFDSLNHIMNLDELTLALRNVYDTLMPDGLFLFDMNMEEAYKSYWNGSFNIVEDDNVCVFRSSYFPEEKTGKIDITIFRLLEEKWLRSDLTLSQRWYSEEEIISALDSMGFVEIRAYDAKRGLEEHIKQSGRTFFVCRKPSTSNK